jgi:hypothetical protein
MGFLRPKIPTAPPAPNPATPAMDAMSADSLIGATGPYASGRSLINTSSRGLTRRASTQRTSLIGGGR